MADMPAVATMAMAAHGQYRLQVVDLQARPLDVNGAAHVARGLDVVLAVVRKYGVVTSQTCSRSGSGGEGGGGGSNQAGMFWQVNGKALQSG